MNSLSGRAKNILAALNIKSKADAEREYLIEPHCFLRTPNCGKLTDKEIIEWIGIKYCVGRDERKAEILNRDAIGKARALLIKNGYKVIAPIKIE